MNQPDVKQRADIIDEVLDKLTINVRHNSLDAAAKVAALYGAPKEAIDAILKLKEPPPLPKDGGQ